MQFQTWHPSLWLCTHAKYYVKSGLTNVLKNANKTKNMHFFFDSDCQLKCLSLLFGKLKLCIFLSFIVLCLLQPTANYDLAIIDDYLAGNAKIKISIKKTKWRRCHIRRALATVANRKCGPENTDHLQRAECLEIYQHQVNRMTDD